MAGLILYTGLGWLLSLWLGHRGVLMAIGALVGLGLSYYLIFTGLSRENKIMQDSKDSKMFGVSRESATDRERDPA
jgi:hypothetical protein